MKTYLLIRGQKGASAVEFAIVLPLLLLIVFGIVEWGMYMFNRHIITNASRTGARRGIVQEVPRVPLSEIQQTVANYSSTHLVTFGIPNDPTVQVSANDVDDAICAKFNDDLEVAVSYNYTFLLLPTFTAGRVSPSRTITARTVMKCE